MKKIMASDERDIVAVYLDEIARTIGTTSKVQHPLSINLSNNPEDQDKELDDSNYEDVNNHDKQVYQALSASASLGKVQQQADILSVLVEHNLIDDSIVMKIISSLVSVNSKNILSNLRHLLEALLHGKSVSKQELLLGSVIQLVRERRFQEARLLFSGIDWNLSKQRPGQKPTPASQACSVLLLAYRQLLDYHSVRRVDNAAETDGSEGGGSGQFLYNYTQRLEEAFFGPQPAFNGGNGLFHIFAEAYVSLLTLSGAYQEAEQFIYRMVDREMADRSASCGISPILAYEIVQLHLPQASGKLNVHILEAIAKIDPSNPLVLKLCRKLHRKALKLKPNNNRRINEEQDDIHSGSDEGIMEEDDPPPPRKKRKKTPCKSPANEETNGLFGRCLELMMSFLDQAQPSRCVKAWNLLADTVRLVCQRGTEKDITELVRLWHLERKDWWPSIYFRLADEDDKSLPDRALFCFLLEDGNAEELHPFVSQVLRRMGNFSVLESLIRQLGPTKAEFSKKIQRLLPSVRAISVDALLASSPPAEKKSKNKKTDYFADEERDVMVITFDGVDPFEEENGTNEDSDSSEGRLIDYSEGNGERTFDVDSKPRGVLVQSFRDPLPSTLPKRFEYRRSSLIRRKPEKCPDGDYAYKPRAKISLEDLAQDEPWRCRLRSYEGEKEFFALDVDPAEFQEYISQYWDPAFVRFLSSRKFTRPDVRLKHHRNSTRRRTKMNESAVTEDLNRSSDSNPIMFTATPLRRKSSGPSARPSTPPL